MRCAAPTRCWRPPADLAGVAEGGTADDGSITVERSPCLGHCNSGVSVNVSHGRPQHNLTFAHVTGSDLEALFGGQGRTTADFYSEDYVGGDLSIVTPLCGRGRRTTLVEYQAVGGMQALRKTLLDRRPAELIALLKNSSLLGRGGRPSRRGSSGSRPARPPGQPKYFVINADESEPGTFKDRILLEGDPSRILEGAIIGAYAMGASRIYIYIRGEYPMAIERVEAAVREFRAAGYLGENILGSGFGIDVEVRSGAGAYICGEETALFESIEGKRGFPRIKPPYPAEFGLFGKPTVVNNVETLAKVPYIVNHGPEAFVRLGTADSTGPKLLCVSGDVVRPGLYEVGFGITLRHLVENLAGGVVGGELQAILIGGAAGMFATPAQLDTPITFQDLRAAGLTLGSGAVMVFNDAARSARYPPPAGAFLRPRVVRQVLSLPARHAAAIRNPRAHRRGRAPARRRGAPGGRRLDDDRRVAVRAGPDGGERGVERDSPLAGVV